MAKKNTAPTKAPHSVMYQEENGEIITATFPTYAHASTLIQRLKTSSRPHKYEGPGENDPVENTDEDTEE